MFKSKKKKEGPILTVTCLFQQILAQLKLEAEVHAPPIANWVIKLQNAEIAEGQRSANSTDVFDDS